MVTCRPNMQVHDDLAALFSRNLTFRPELQSQALVGTQVQAPEQPSTAVEENPMIDSLRESPTQATSTLPNSNPEPKPITYSISQHYTHSAHLHRPAVSQVRQEEQSAATQDVHQQQRRSSEPPQTEQLTAEFVLSQNGVDPTVLSRSQHQLFRISDPDQQARLVELWRVAPPTSSQDNPSLAWTTTTYEQEERWAKLRYDRSLEAERARQNGNFAMSLDGTPVQIEDGRWLASSNNVEPYMMSGYEELMRREQEREQRRQRQQAEGRSPKNVYSHFGTAVGSNNSQAYSRATDPVYRGSAGDWPVQQQQQQQQMQQQMQMQMYTDHPYGQYDVFQQQQFGGPAGNMEAMEIM
ncbi:hypothetical protein SODALDRAFT_334283 [Sodiomyces alkalinus F11]|uniref:Uncharacterized protein n=1 Tax=Sodiomyces alkalinus (strain CBS 110278 / VKM F-3762 / F11) TaxID=1314773 RepID=A0A3N2PRQ5_SODAK|nr:hypothetical protein SODALDRAFT_334283 [Sodiomyces alkalinus F11]ROT37201.1 hypothetical protein SODALDRAFT_334283 [Sodiomyces alkalinus F11]